MTPVGNNQRRKSTATELTSVIDLATNNFESFVARCFAGEECRLIDDPWEMYEHFKLTGNTKANDNLIALMRRLLGDEKFKAQNKDKLLQMIEDFYPQRERQFQEAAYYNYLGDLPKSLELYLELERKADPSLRGAPKLNIANIYYDLGQLRKALPYYEAALAVSHDNDVTRFIDDRIATIRARF